jgi:hypothetical protein
MTPELSKALAELKAHFAVEIANGDIRHLGTYNCRRKNNTTDGPWSEHAWPNAVDVMIRDFTGRKALGDRIAAWMRARTDLWSEVFWQIFAHYDHVHGTARPRRNFDNKQIPPCATGDTDMELITQIQTALNKAGAKDYEGKAIVVDGKWGPRTESAFINGLKLGGVAGVTETRVKTLIKAARLTI